MGDADFQKWRKEILELVQMRGENTLISDDVLQIFYCRELERDEKISELEFDANYEGDAP